MGILFYDKGGKLTDVNQSTLKIAGISKTEDIKAVNLFDNIFINSKKDELLQKGLINLQTSVNFDNVKNLGIYNSSRSGIVFIDLNIFVIDSGFLVQLQDINEIKKAEESLQESEKRFRALFEHSNDAIVIADLNTGKYIDFNKKLEELTGYSREELLHMSAGDLSPENIRNENIKQFDIIKKRPIRIETELLTKDRAIFPIEISSSILEIENKKYAQGVFRDITERKAKEEILKQAHSHLEEQVNERTWELKKSYESLMQRERLYRTLAENSPFAIRRLDNEFKFIYSNKGSSVSELSKEDFVGKTIDEIGMNEDIVKSWKRCGQKVFTTGENQEIVNEIPLSNGFITFKSTIVPEFDIKDEIESILVITEDITEFKKTENELKISKENFRTLAENSPDTIIRLDKDMKYAYVNPVITENSGKPPEYYIGKRYDEVGIPEKYVKIFEENNRKAIENGEIQRYEFEFPTIKGMKYIESIAIPEFNANEEIESLLILDRDITERKNFEDSLKESRAQLRIAMDLAKLVSWQYDVESDLFTFDNHFYALYGTSAEREGGTLLSSEKYARKFIPPEEVSIVKEEIDRAIKTDNPNFVENMEHSIIRADGEKRYINVRFGVIKDKNGKTIKTFGSNQDITSLKETEEQLKETIKELERSNEELQQFAYVSSHDLQEPLRTIASFTQLLERRYKGKLDSDADEFMDYIVEASVRMKAQIEGLLEYSRVGTKGEEFKPADMNEILNKTIQSLNTSIKEIDTNIKVDELPVVMGDGNQLQRVFQNLISNAIKFKKQEEPLKIHVYANKDICNNEYVFSVQDNGIGIEEQYNERIFTIFQRLHTRDVYEGTGIGLSVVKRIIERHGGRVWVESSFGKGSTFYFTIPISGSEF